MSYVEDRKPISLEELRKKARGFVVDIPEWVGEGTIPVQVRGIDMTPFIMKLDKLPNPLKNAAVEVFEGKSDKPLAELNPADLDDLDEINAMLPIIEDVCRAILVSPTYDEFEEVYPMTLTQKMALFEVATGGLNDLKTFRK